MANQITDGRTSINTMEAITNIDDLSGGASGSLDSSTFIQGSNSVTMSITNSRRGLLHDAGSAQDWSNNHFYLWLNCGIVGLLDTKANGGVTIRFCGATVTDWFEFNVGGSDSWPDTIEGGWAQFVIDIEGTPSATNGTPPATTAIRYVGFSAITTVMPKMADNFWIDEFARLPDGSAGVIIEGRNGGITDWTSSDIPTQLGVGAGMFRPTVGGAFALNAPVQFGIADTSTHAFTDTNQIWLWENQEWVADDFYLVNALGAAGGTTNVTMGSKTGTGAAATGAQGIVIAGDSAGPVWDMDFDDPDIDGANFYGCSFVNGGDFQFDDIAVEVISTVFVGSVNVEATNSDAFLRNSYIASGPAVDVGALVWNENVDVDGILDGSVFEKGAAAHHSIDFGAAVVADVTLRDCSFNGFGTTEDGNDAALRFLATTGSLNCNLIGCTVDGAAASASNLFKDDAAGIAVTLVFDPVTTLVNVKDNQGVNLSGARVLLEASDGTGDFPFQDTVTITRSGATATVSHTAHGMIDGDIAVIRGADQQEYNGPFVITNVTANAYDYTVSGAPATPATGTIDSTGAILNGTTDGSGNIVKVRSFASTTPVTGFVRKSTTSPRFKSFQIAGTVSTSTGLTVNVRMIIDE